MICVCSCCVLSIFGFCLLIRCVIVNRISMRIISMVVFLNLWVIMFGFGDFMKVKVVRGNDIMVLEKGLKLKKVVNLVVSSIGDVLLILCVVFRMMVVVRFDCVVGSVMC